MFRLLDALGVSPTGVSGPGGLVWSMLDPLLMLRNNSVTFWPHFQCHRCGPGEGPSLYLQNIIAQSLGHSCSKISLKQTHRM